MNFNLISVALTSILLTTLLLNKCKCKLTTEQFHCNTEVYFPSKISGEFDLYRIDEYVDLVNSRSSLKLENVLSGENKIFYKETFPLGQPSSSSLIVYNIDNNSCKSTSVYDQSLFYKIRSITRKLLLKKKLSKKSSGVAFGPSAILLAIEESLDELYFTEKTFSKDRLANVDVYERLVNFDLKSMIVRVQILSQSNTQKGMTLANAANSKGKDINLVSVVIFEVRNDDLKEIGTVYECDDSDISVFIHFYTISEMTTGSLLGMELDEAGDFDYHQDPFLQPTGIGCAMRESRFAGRKKFNAPSMQFSAEYTTIKNFKDLSYVAFDGYGNILRLDRFGRKSIYDLDRFNSYHINEYNSVEDLNDIPDEGKNCIVLEISDETLKSSTIMERLIGIGIPGQTTAYYLGSKIIDHIVYEVYESLLDYDQLSDKSYNLPILMETQYFKMPWENMRSTKSYFMTFYLNEYDNNLDIRNQDDDIMDRIDTILVPKFIELWELIDHGRKREKKLINRLKFTEFTWSLNVEPSGDPDSQDLSRLFNIESCAEDRSSQYQLRYRVVQDRKESLLDEKIIPAFKSNTQLIKELIHERLASAFEISRLNIVHLNILFLQNTANFMVESRIVELRTGLSEDTMLGYARCADLFMKSLSTINSIIRIKSNRHSLDSCKVDLTSEGKENSLMYCKGLALCILLKDEAISEQKLKIEKVGEPDLIVSSFITEAVCEIHQHYWASKPVDEKKSALTRVADNLFKLTDSRFEINFRYNTNEPSNKKTEIVTYRGYTGYELKSLDSIGSVSTKSLLDGLRYTTVAEEPKSSNMNTAVKLIEGRDDNFNYCQMACQFDSFCESFSICLRRNKKEPTQHSDCILSTLSFSRKSLANIRQLLMQKNSSSDDGFKFKFLNDSESQIIRFKRDNECSLHPKDYISLFKITDSFNALKGIKSEESGSIKKDGGKVLTLEDCARSCEEASSWNNLINSSFIYCPTKSLCFLENNSTEKLINNLHCYRYSKFHTHFYNKLPLRRFSIRIEGYGEHPWSYLVANQNMDDLKIGHMIEGLSEDECARDCSLRESKCLAFDSCRITSNIKTCYLFLIRSQTSIMNKKLGFLSQEKPFYSKSESGESTSNNSALLIRSNNCNHFSLKDTYFYIRIQQLLDEEQNPTGGKSQRDQINELEDSIINKDEKNSDRISSELIESKKKWDTSATVTSDKGGGIHILLLFFGIIVGFMGILYGERASIYTTDLWEYMTAKRSQRFADHRISQLALSNNLEL